MPPTHVMPPLMLAVPAAVPMHTQLTGMLQFVLAVLQSASPHEHIQTFRLLQAKVLPPPLLKHS